MRGNRCSSSLQGCETAAAGAVPGHWASAGAGAGAGTGAGAGAGAAGTVYSEPKSEPEA